MTGPRFVLGALLVGTFAFASIAFGARSARAATETRAFSFEYEVVVPADVPDAETLTLFLPIAADTTGQRVLGVDVEASDGVRGRFGREDRHGNRFWVAELPARRPSQTRIVVKYLSLIHTPSPRDA